MQKLSDCEALQVISLYLYDCKTDTSHFIVAVGQNTQYVTGQSHHQEKHNYISRVTAYSHVQTHSSAKYKLRGEQFCIK